MDHLFIINPAAGKSDQTKTFSQKIQQVFTNSNETVQIAVSQHAGHCAQLARQAAEASTQELRIYACGGDGTLNEVVNGAVGFSHVSITHFPGGSGNDFIKIFDHPEDFQNLSSLLDARESVFDLIECNGHYALNICSLGIDARIGTSVSRYKRLPLVTGSGAYLLSTLINVIKGIHRHYCIEIDGRVIDGRKTMICVANGSYYGGGFHPVPEADPTDSLLDVLLVDAVSRLKVAQVIGDYKAGQWAKYPDLIEHCRTRQLVVHCDEESEINLDGELLMGKDVTFRIAPEKIRFFYPKVLHREALPVL